MNIFALADCNNFYVSCERVFNPKLEQEAVIVLSSNTGCVVARSNEAKALGIKMGVPLFEIQSIVEKQDVKILASNFELYGDMSERVMATLNECVPHLEIYSIDEAFFSLKGFQHPVLYAEQIRKKVLQWTGMPISIGIAKTKTLAKLANHVAKKIAQVGVFAFDDESIQRKLFSKIKIENIWGVGKKLNQTLQDYSIFTVEDFVNANSNWLFKKFGVHLFKTQQELKGESCLHLEEKSEDQKSIMSSRSFGKTVNTLEELTQAATYHISNIASKLREQNLLVQQLYVYVYHSAPRKQERLKKISALVSLPFFSNATLALLSPTLAAVKKIYQSGLVYKKLGVVAFELISKKNHIPDLFSSPNAQQEKAAIALDKINHKFGANTLFHGSFGMNPMWFPKRTLRSPRYTTQWTELLAIR